MDVLDGLSLREPGLPGYRCIHLLQLQGGDRILRRQVDDIDVGFRQPSLLEQHIDVELRDAAAEERDRLTLEVGDRADLFRRKDAVAAERLVGDKQAGQRLFARLGERRSVGRRA
jgi:hypothetical protein